MKRIAMWLLRRALRNAGFWLACASLAACGGVADADTLGCPSGGRTEPEAPQGVDGSAAPGRASTPEREEPAACELVTVVCPLDAPQCPLPIAPPSLDRCVRYLGMTDPNPGKLTLLCCAH